MAEYLEHIVSVTIFLALFLLIRAVFYSRISKRVCYAMWLVAGIYLLTPFGKFSNPFQVLNMVYQAAGDRYDGNTQEHTAGDRYDGNIQERDALRADFDGDDNGDNDDNGDIGTRATGQERVSGDFTNQNSSELGIISDVRMADTAGTDAAGSDAAQNNAALKSQKKSRNWKETLLINKVWLVRLWLLGCVICLTVFAASGRHFMKRLQKSREPLEVGEGLRRIGGRGCIPVYQTKELSTPCLFGVVCPAIYLPKEHTDAQTNVQINARADTQTDMHTKVRAKGQQADIQQIRAQMQKYVLLHEYTHYRHGDHIWAVLRCLCVSLYWYHPLVWLAAVLSGRDSEFACDESVTRAYDAKERRAYGETLILFGTGGGDNMVRFTMRLFTGASGINGGSRELKKRITLIAAKGRQRTGAAVLACTLLLAVTGCTVGSPSNGNQADRSDASDNHSSIGYESEHETTEQQPTQAAGDDLAQAAGNQDLVPVPYDFAGIMQRTQENGIAYYNVVTERDMPLPLNEWAKINIFTEQGNAVTAYVRFTQVIRDMDEIRAHVDHYAEVRGSQEPSGMVDMENMQCVLLQYEILVAEENTLDGKDRIPPMAVDYPLRLYSTLENGRFAIQGIERSVRDLSLLDQEWIEPGDTISKEALCYVPMESTAYGVEFPYMTAQRGTGMVYFKLEYE